MHAMQSQVASLSGETSTISRRWASWMHVQRRIPSVPVDFALQPIGGKLDGRLVIPHLAYAKPMRQCDFFWSTVVDHTEFASQ